MTSSVKKMDKKKDRVKNTQVKGLSGKSAVDFVGDIKSELKKITWTSRDELQTYTKIVIAATFVFGIGIYCSDLMIQTVLSGLSQVVSFLVG